MPSSTKPVPLAHLSPVWPPPRDAYVWEIGRGPVWLGALAIVALLWFAVPAFFKWPHTISSWGGRYFIHRTVIPVPAFQQNDPRWSLDLLGNSIDTLGQSGCAVSSAAMVLSSYGIDTDPQRLNVYLTGHGGYVGEGLLVWEKASELGAGWVRKGYEDAPSYALIDQNLLEGNPVIVRLTLRNGTTHFVVVVGKEGWDYIIRDPARPPAYGIYPLRNLTPRIEALRFYKIGPLPFALAHPAPAATPPPAGPALVEPAPLTAAPNLSVPATTPPFKSDPTATPPLPPFVYTNSTPLVLVPSATKPKVKKKHRYTFPPLETNVAPVAPAAPAPPPN